MPPGPYRRTAAAAKSPNAVRVSAVRGGYDAHSPPKHSHPSSAAAQSGVPKRNGSVVIPERAFAATMPSVDPQSYSPRSRSTWAHGNQSRIELIPASAISPASESSNDR